MISIYKECIKQSIILFNEKGSEDKNEMMGRFNQPYRYGRKLCPKHKKLAKFYQTLLRTIYQCDIPLNANIAEDVYFCHDGFGTVISSWARIKSGCCIQNGVLIGERKGVQDVPLIKKMFLLVHMQWF